MNSSFLDHLEPNTPPSLRYTRIVPVGMADVLEMRDPNDGQDSGPESKTRYQYVLAGGEVWTRRLPPETVGDAWVDTGVPPWERLEGTPGGIVAEYALLARLARPIGVAVLRRERFYAAGTHEYRIGGKYVPADDLDCEVVMGPITDSWHAVPLPPCPDCGGSVVWAEAGYVPGTRECCGCGSMFTVAVRPGELA